jgi:hypothetical protein
MPRNDMAGESGALDIRGAGANRETPRPRPLNLQGTKRKMQAERTPVSRGAETHGANAPGNTGRAADGPVAGSGTLAQTPGTGGIHLSYIHGEQSRRSAQQDRTQCGMIRDGRGIIPPDTIRDIRRAGNSGIDRNRTGQQGQNENSQPTTESLPISVSSKSA